MNVADEEDDEHNPPSRHQLVQLTVYSEPVYALLDSGATPDVMSTSLAQKLKLQVEPTNCRFIVVNGASEIVEGVVTNVPVGFGVIVSHLKFLVLDSVPFDLIISDPIQIKVRIKIDMYLSTVKVRANGKIETLNLEYEPGFGEGSDGDFTSASDTDTHIPIP